LSHRPTDRDGAIAPRDPSCINLTETSMNSIFGHLDRRPIDGQGPITPIVTLSIAPREAPAIPHDAPASIAIPNRITPTRGAVITIISIIGAIRRFIAAIIPHDPKTIGAHRT
jgi:hypothetical protein